MGAPASNADSGDGSPAHQAHFVPPMCHFELSLSHPLIAIGEAIGTDAGPVVEYSPLQNLSHGLMQAIYLANRKVIRSLHGMDSGSKQGLIGIHITHTGYGMLIAK